MRNCTTPPEVETVRTIRDETCPMCGHPEMFTELDAKKLQGKEETYISSVIAFGCNGCGLYRTDLARFLTEVNLLETLRSGDGAGYALDGGEYHEPWLEVEDGAIDIQHLVTDVLALAHALSEHYPDHLRREVER